MCGDAGDVGLLHVDFCGNCPLWTWLIELRFDTDGGKRTLARVSSEGPSGVEPLSRIIRRRRSSRSLLWPEWSIAAAEMFDDGWKRLFQISTHLQAAALALFPLAPTPALDALSCTREWQCEVRTTNKRSSSSRFQSAVIGAELPAASSITPAASTRARNGILSVPRLLTRTKTTAPRGCKHPSTSRHCRLPDPHWK